MVLNHGSLCHLDMDISSTSFKHKTQITAHTVSLHKPADTDSLSKIDVSRNAGGTDVEPVVALGREFSCVREFNGIGPAF
jgi:hypothetical protein